MKKQDGRTPTAAEAHLPLKPVVFHILLALAAGPSHGYGLMQAVRERSEGRIHLTTGPFYRHLRWLLDAGFVTESARRPPDDDPRRGAYYELTVAGRELVSAEGRRLQRLVSETAALGLIAKGS